MKKEALSEIKWLQQKARANGTAIIVDLFLNIKSLIVYLIGAQNSRN